MSKTYSAKLHDLQPLVELSADQHLEAFRTMPISLGTQSPRAFVSFYSANYDIDASLGMFCYPTDTLKIMVFTETGEILWKQDLGKGVVPGTAFCNFFAFDLDGDGVDEIWFVNNLDAIHPFNIKEFCLERINPLDGKTTGQWPWPQPESEQSLSHTFRSHILGGYAHQQPVLVTVQGTYGPMAFQAWNPDMTLRWQRTIQKNEPGARGSHVWPILDINNDGIEEFLWGERCIEFDTGRDVFCADKERWNGHSDMIQPLLDPSTGRWFIYANRETKPEVGPRVILYNDQGERVWSALDHGHVHKGWIGRIGTNGKLIANAIIIGGQTKTLTARHYSGVSEYAFEALTGKPVQLPYSLFDTAPIDVNGDGYHEIVRGVAGGDAEVLDRQGNLIKKIGGRVAACSKVLDHRGEQLLCYYPDGTIRIWGDTKAVDSAAASKRYNHRFYQANQRCPTKEYVMCMLGGL